MTTIKELMRIFPTADAEQLQKLQVAVENLKPEAMEIVAGLEDSPMKGTTKDNYGYYLHWLQPLAKHGAFGAVLLALALKDAGANGSGVWSALSLVTGRTA